MDPVQIIQTLLTAGLVGVCGWTAKTVLESSQKLAAIHEDLKAKTYRIDGHDRDIIELRTRLTRLEIEVAEFRARSTHA